MLSSIDSEPTRPPRPAAQRRGERGRAGSRPEGDPDQLLAEASVYLRYGKTRAGDRQSAGAFSRRSRTIVPPSRSSARPTRKPDRIAEAIDVWMQAAEQLRRPVMPRPWPSSRIASPPSTRRPRRRSGAVEAGAATGSVPNIDLDLGEVGTPSVELDLDLDVEVDLDLDSAIDEVAASETSADLGFSGPRTKSSRSSSTRIRSTFDDTADDRVARRGGVGGAAVRADDARLRV